jgi:hypothetical protein
MSRVPGSRSRRGDMGIDGLRDRQSISAKGLLTSPSRARASGRDRKVCGAIDREDKDVASGRHSALGHCDAGLTDWSVDSCAADRRPRTASRAIQEAWSACLRCYEYSSAVCGAHISMHPYLPSVQLRSRLSRDARPRSGTLRCSTLGGRCGRCRVHARGLVSHQRQIVVRRAPQRRGSRTRGAISCSHGGPDPT